MADRPKMTREKLDRMAEVVRSGGGVRRRHKAVRKSATSAEDTKLQHNLKRLGVSPIGDIEEVNLIMDNGTVIHFDAPKVQAAVQSNTFVVSGNSETKSFEAMLPSILQHLGSENAGALEALKEKVSEK
eukprot:TRINITY_DN432_c0_g1_i1.p2 TRINITY_DN432_c0_g1~~TRINITY_DN432_c0_g1_i1.p2  ORF type:complete len:129 (+),score=47.18 TRINITY_DN432_c0_g1_i1:91-477(+)